ncbi:MAG: glycoside hydrolase family 31 protein [Chitinophagaceae bacterium]
MWKKKLLSFASLICTVAILAFAATPPVGDYSKLDNGIIVKLKTKSRNGASLVKLQAITDKIIHVTATPLDSFAKTTSLMVTDEKRNPVKWDVKEGGNSITLYTAAINATVSLETGEVNFTDKAGNPILQESKDEGKTFTPIFVEGESAYKVKQTFVAAPGEAYYGLGQHQQGIMNYRGYQVNLEQYNTEVAVPFLVSSKNYGILWDNYSITRVGDTRQMESLSGLRLYAADGSEGWLTATYSKKSNPSEILLQRPESSIAYEYLDAMKNFPPTIKLGSAVVKWDGSIESGVSGQHKFLFRYAGYAKIWVGGKLVANRWRQAWNPGYASFEVDMEKGKKYPITIEWNPDGDESYISLKWLSPLQGNAKNELSFLSESGDQVDYYFVYGNNMDEVISGYRNITGKAPIMPKWAMGLWQSRERYKTQDEIINTVAEFRKRKIPIDNIVLDWSYWKENQWGSQEFDTARFPDPDAMIKDLHEKYNTQFMISVWAKFYEGIPTYKDFDSKGFLYKRNIADQRRDWIGKGYTSTFYDALNPAAREAFWLLLNTKLYKKGIDAWWLDSTEPDIHSNLSAEERKKLMTPTALGNSTRYFNAFALQNAQGVYLGQRKTNPDKRVFILTRSAYAGSQRYAAATWSGDVAARWDDLRDQIPAGINFSMSGIPYWTVDIGGFSVEKRFEKAQGETLEEWREMVTRWYQFGAFCPLFRVHGQFPYREIYNVAPEEHPAYKSMLYYDKLRYRLMPYFYSLAGKTYHDNYTIMRGLIMDFGADEAVKNIGDQYMLGPSFMVNPVYNYKARERDVYLPATTGWYDFYTGEYKTGGQHISAVAPMERMPLFVKEGSIIPAGPELQYSTEKPANVITLYVYTGKDTQFNLYEDENTNYRYEQGAFANIPITYNEQEKTLTIGTREGAFDGMLQKRTFRIVWVTKNKATSFDPDKSTAQALQYTGKEQKIRIPSGY